MRDRTELLTFDPEEPEAVLAAMDELGSAQRGWVNLEPEVPAEHVPDEPSGTGRLFAARGPAIPLCTWAPASGGPRKTGPVTIGVQHGSGGRAMPRLGELGLELPGGWVVRADHPRRGLVVEIRVPTDDRSTLDWLLAAGEALATTPLTGRWLAAITRPDRGKRRQATLAGCPSTGAADASASPAREVAPVALRQEAHHAVESAARPRRGEDLEGVLSTGQLHVQHLALARRRPAAPRSAWRPRPA